METGMTHDFEARCRHIGAFDSREHRDGRSDHAVAVEQCRAEQADQHEHDPPAA